MIIYKGREGLAGSTEIRGAGYQIFSPYPYQMPGDLVLAGDTPLSPKSRHPFSFADIRRKVNPWKYLVFLALFAQRRCEI